MKAKLRDQPKIFIQKSISEQASGFKYAWLDRQWQELHLPGGNFSICLVCRFTAFFLQFIADSFYVRGLASKFVHLFISTLHFPNQVFCSLWLSCSKVPSCNSLILLLESLLIIISYFKGRGIRLQRSTAVLDNRQCYCLPTQYFYFWWGMTSIYWKCSPAVEERLLGRQNALWCARCCEAILGSLRSYWWCWLQVHFYNDQLWLESTGQIPRELILNQEEQISIKPNLQPGRTDFN